MNAPVSPDLFGQARHSKAEKILPCLPSKGFMPGAKVPLPIAPPPKNGPRKIVVADSFAGGGGATEGCEMALQTLQDMGLLPSNHDLKVTYAINHDDAAIAMHEANHRETIHLPHNVWKVSMCELIGDNYFGLLWLSPDCRDHSPAKGGPITSRSVRDLAWVLVRWLKELPDWQRPWVICLENVPAFSKWSPLIPLPDGKYERDKNREGEIFHRFVKAVAAFGYHIGWTEIMACEHGSPTIRKRLKMVFRRDGQKPVWPKATHGNPQSEEVKSGKLQPWPVAADIVDFDQDCPSILMTEEEAREYTARTGRRIIRPLATKSEARVAYGVKRHVLDAIEPFIVTCNHGGDGFRGLGMSEPFPTVTRSRDAHGLVVPTIAPFISHGQHGGRSRSIKDPHHAVTASRKDQNQVVAVHIAQHNTGVIGRGANVPLSTIMSRGTTQALVAATFIKRDFGNSIGSDMKDPVGAVTAGGGGKTLLAAAYMMSFKGSNRRTGRCENPHPAICASGQHSAVITMPLMTAYYSEGGQTASIRDPMLAVPTKARFGLAEVYGFEPPLTDDQLRRARQVADFLRKYGCWDDREFVTIEKAGRILVLIDIGMRMLKPRELARAQGLSDRYILAAPYNGGYLSETEQRHKIGNMVCPQPAAAVIVENYRPPLEWGQTDFMEAAE